MYALKTRVRFCKSAESWFFTCRWILAFWHAIQLPTQGRMSLLMFVHTKRVDVIFCVERILGWHKQWTAVKTSHRFCSGMYGCSFPVEISHHIWPREGNSGSSRNLRDNEFRSLETFFFVFLICGDLLRIDRRWSVQDIEVDARKCIRRRIGRTSDMSNIRRMLRDEIELMYFSLEMVIGFCFISVHQRFMICVNAENTSFQYMAEVFEG